MKPTKKKFKIVAKPKQNTKEFRMFDFKTHDHKNEEHNKIFRIQMFGINEHGETVALFVDNFQPFFYVKVPNKWTQNSCEKWFEETKKCCKSYTRHDCLYTELETHSKLYEFTANTSYKFAKCVFRNMASFYEFKQNINTEIFNTYECGIPPLLRYFHIHKISPSGWIQINVANMIPGENTTTCTYEYYCGIDDIVPLPQKETPVPYKIASFDIEASSSHGDFPVPIKDYKRMATQTIDLYDQKKAKQKMNVDATKSWLKKAILSVFSIGSSIDGLDVVYTKDPIFKDEIKECVKIVFEKSLEHESLNKESAILETTSIFEKMMMTANQNNDGDDATGQTDFLHHNQYAEEIRQNNSKKKEIITKEQKKQNICQLISDPDYSREIRIQMLNQVMTLVFPPLKGDEITFIGTTFLNYGSKEPYKNHCIVVGSCDPVENVEICTVENEKDCLVEWKELIQAEDPDIIIGYNIFGFDYQFMFYRAKELDCVEDFCSFSRIKDEMCYKEDRNTNEKRLDHTQNRLASGDYDLHYPPLSGRLQIDLLFYFRRDYNMSSYKLDDVAGTMIRDDIKGLRVENNTTYLYSKNLAGLHVGDFIHLEISTFTTDYVEQGKKFKVVDIEKSVAVENVNNIPDGTYNVIAINGDYSYLDCKKQVLKWGMAKDDVTPQDIFRLSKESAKSRAIVAKYCVQDCNLVHHLMNKVDVLTGYIEMARICNVPINFLVFRGQGIKLTSYVAKVCREKNTLMPDLEKTENDDGYEGAIVLPPKCAMYGENPVACNDYSSLYPSIAKGWNLSPNSKVWSKNFDLNGNLIKINDVVVTETNKEKLLAECDKYDNLDGYKYINVTFDSFEYKRRETSTGGLGAKIKTKCGTKMVRWAQFPNGQEGIIPCIIGDLLKARKETRVKAESEADPFLANVLDKRQLGYKVTANSLYGQMGSSVSTFFEKDVAASITAIGRMMITYAKKMVEMIYGNSVYESKEGGEVRVARTRSQYVYGDSVASYTPVCIKVKNTINITCIENLASEYGNDNWVLCQEEGKQDKEYCELKDVQSWTEQGWTTMHRIIRHKLAPHKKMVRVLTHTGLVDVTDDHSLLTIRGKEVSPNDLRVGHLLLHNQLPICEHTMNRVVMEICDTKTFTNQLECARYVHYLRCHGYYSSIHLDDKHFIVQKHANIQTDCAIKKIHNINYDGYVYDLTTENHHFSAGIGNMIVHNTDSVFFTFNLEDPETGEPIRGKEALKWTIEIAEEAANLCSLFLPPPMKLAYEKTLMSFILLSKKRYVGMLYEYNPDKGKLKFMGLPLKRRDSCDYLKDVYGGILTILMKEPDNVEKAIEFLNQSLKSLVNGNVSMDKLALTKALRSEYKNPQQIAHKVLAERIGEREPGNKPKPGDRIKYAFIENAGEKLLGNRVETPQYIIENNLKLDYHYYITNQLMNPLLQLFSLALEKVYLYKKKKQRDIAELQTSLDKLFESCEGDLEVYMKKREKLCSSQVKQLLFDPFLTEIYNAQNGIKTLLQFYKKA